MPRLRRPLAILATLLVSGGLTACGNHPDENARIVRAETEGLYLDIGELKYQVEVSRQLNPDDFQDKAYLTGISQTDRRLQPDEVWFGIFMRVQNETGEARPPAPDLKIVDTQGEAFRPITLDATNPFALRRTEPVPAHDVIPLRDTPGFDTPTRGALVLFKLTLTSLGNRPLELHIASLTARPQTGIIDLDV